MNAETIEMTGAQLKQQREACGLTQTQLAACLGYKRSGLAHWEQGRHPIPSDVLPRLRAVLDACSVAGAAVAVRTDEHWKGKVRIAIKQCRRHRIRADGLAAELADARAELHKAHSAARGLDKVAARLALSDHLESAPAELRDRIIDAIDVAEWSSDARAQFDGSQVELQLPLADTVDKRDREACMRTLVKLTCKRVAEWAEGCAVPVGQMWEAYKLLSTAAEE